MEGDKLCITEPIYLYSDEYTNASRLDVRYLEEDHGFKSWIQVMDSWMTEKIYENS